MILISCSNDDDQENHCNIICSVENPTENLDWLKSEITMFESNEDSYNYIILAEYNNETIFIFANCNPFIDSVFIVKDCEGNDINIIGDETDNVPFTTLTSGEIIWISDKSECSF